VRPVRSRARSGRIACVSEQREEALVVSLRPWVRDDREFLAQLFGDPEVRRFVGGPVEPEEASRRATQLTEDTPWGYFVVIEGCDPVGTVTFDRKRGPWEVSFQLCRSAWGRGVMTRALHQAVEWFRANEPHEHLIAVTQVRNESARRTIERSGGVRERAFQQYGDQQVQYTL
jgi:ribosomal-protein-alanine N-acetyltransferase